MERARRVVHDGGQHDGELWAGRIEQTERRFRVPHTSWRGVTVKTEELFGGDATTNAGFVRDILSGKDRGPRRDNRILNAAAALVVAEKDDRFCEWLDAAAE